MSGSLQSTRTALEATGSGRDIGAALEQTLRLPLRLQVPALAEALLIAHGEESDACAMRLIEIAGYNTNPWESKTSGAVELVKGLADAWRARYAPKALEALARGWTSLTPSTRPVALALGRTRWIGVTAELAEREDRDARLVALSIARDTADPGFGGLVCRLLHDPDKDVRIKADKVLLHLTLRLLSDTPSVLLGDELDAYRRHPSVPMHADGSVLELERCALMSAVSDAAWNFAAHRCRSPLLATLLLADLPTRHPVAQRAQSRMRRLLAERNHPSHAPLRSVVQRTDCPVLRLGAWRWCTMGAMARVSAQRLERAESVDEHRIVLGAMHLALSPSRRRTLGTLRNVGAQSVVMSRAAYAQLDADARRGYLRWVSLLDVEPQVKHAQIEPALADPDALVRVTGHELSDPIERTDYLFDDDAAVARHASLSWSSVGVTPPTASSQSATRRLTLARTLGASPNPWVRRVAREEAARIRTDLPDSPASRLQARRLYEQDPAKFARTVRVMLAEADTQLDALSLVLRLGVSARFTKDLVAIARDAGADARARATAVRGLGEIMGHDAAGAARVCLEDDDPRLRANSLETPHVEHDLLVELKEDPHHRVRSSAIRKLLAVDTTSTKGIVDSLSAMLGDGREPHRVAGVWAAQRTVERDLFGEPRPRVRPILDRLAELAAGDPSPQIRRRARTCLRRVEADHAPVEPGGTP